MSSNSGPWPGFPTQYTGYPSYYPGVLHTTNTTNIPHPVPYASDSGSSLANTRLTANAREFVPGGTAGSATLTPSPGFPLPKKKTIRISNPRTGEAVVLRPPDLAAGTAGIPKPTEPERPLTKKERKRKAKLEAEEKQRQEEEEEAKRKVDEEERLKKLEEEEQKKRKEEGQSKWDEEFERRRREIEEETRIEQKRIKEEEREKGEAKAKAKEEKKLRKLAEEADAKLATTVKGLGKKKEVPRLPTTSAPSTGTPVSQPYVPGGFGFFATQGPPIASSLSRNWALVWKIVDLSRVTYPEGIVPPSAELGNGRMPGGRYKHVYDRDFLLQFMPICKEEPEWASNLDGLGVKGQGGVYGIHNLLYEPPGRAQGRRVRAMGGASSSISTGVGVGRGLTGLPGRNPFLPLNGESGSSLKASEERFRASAKHSEATAILQSASSSPHTQGRPVNQDSSVGLASLKDKGALQPDLAEDEESTKGAAVKVRNDHVTINAISELSKGMEQLLREMKDLKDEVRELRSLTQREDKKERGKVRTPPGSSFEGGAPKIEPSLESPYRESSCPTAKPRTATAVNPYFIMKEGELDFVQGDVITILDPPQDSPSPRGSGWLYGEINITKRGFFPASYVKLQK